jgi:magnesium transporter
LLGILYGIILGGVGWLRFVKQGHFVMEVAPIALALGVAMAMAMMVAATIAAALPLFFAKVGVDPAVATGPFVTTSIDIVGVLIYFNAVALFL